MENLRQIGERIKGFLDIPIFKLGEKELTLWLLIYLIALIILLFYVSGKLKKWLVEKLLARTDLDIGIRQATGTIFRYLMVVVGFVIILQTVGIDLTALNILAGAVGIGIGFGLQNIANNFMSGLIILFERPIKIGDRIEIGNVSGDVIHIGARSTSVLTNDNITIIIPNSKFISENVVNWSRYDRKVRFKIPVNVAYDSDVRLVEKLLLEVADENPDVLKNPVPGVRFLEFGDSGLLFELRAWSTSLLHRQGKLISSINFGIYDKFKQHKIEIPFPQRELHIHSGKGNLQRQFLSNDPAAEAFETDITEE
jgi:small-conductance mechanosensitive channel